MLLDRQDDWVGAVDKTVFVNSHDGIPECDRRASSMCMSDDRIPVVAIPYINLIYGEAVGVGQIGPDISRKILGNL